MILFFFINRRLHVMLFYYFHWCSSRSEFFRSTAFRSHCLHFIGKRRSNISFNLPPQPFMLAVVRIDQLIISLTSINASNVQSIWLNISHNCALQTHVAYYILYFIEFHLFYSICVHLKANRLENFHLNSQQAPRIILYLPSTDCNIK